MGSFWFGNGSFQRGLEELLRFIRLHIWVVCFKGKRQVPEFLSTLPFPASGSGFKGLGFSIYKGSGFCRMLGVGALGV